MNKAGAVTMDWKREGSNEGSSKEEKIQRISEFMIEATAKREKARNYRPERDFEDWDETTAESMDTW